MALEIGRKLNTMRILMFGAGAIGSYIGGSLALAGEDVVFFEREDVAVKLRTSGIKLGLPDGEKSVREPQIFSTLQSVFQTGKFDLAVLAVKGFDTAGVLEILKPFMDEVPPILCLQNGVENEPAIAAALGEHKVIQGTVTTAIGRRGLGDIVVERFRGTGIDLNHPLAASVLAACNRAGLGMLGFQNGKAMKWSKMLTNLMANATSAIMNWPPAKVYANPGLFKLERLQLLEVLAVMDALHIPVVDLPGTPVRLLAFGLRYLPAFILRPLLVKAVGGGRGAKMPSFHIDLYFGRGQSEVDWLNGAVVRASHTVGLEAPVNALLTDVLLKLTSGEWKKESFDNNPEELLTLLK
jgi:2-dehydropantoate 2-reductase